MDFFERLVVKYTTFLKSYCISCLVQLVRIKFLGFLNVAFHFSIFIIWSYNIPRLPLPCLPPLFCSPCLHPLPVFLPLYTPPPPPPRVYHPQSSNNPPHLSLIPLRLLGRGLGKCGLMGGKVWGGGGVNLLI